jgi:hypothetical protein
MIANSYNIDQSVSSKPRADWAAWRLWKVVFPRRSITERLVWGTVGGAGTDGIGKKFVEYADE